MINTKFKVGDTVSLHVNDNFIIKGIVYINGTIPMGKFYKKHFSTNDIYDRYQVTYDDVYESALVIIDDKNAESLFVITLENNEYNLFVWNDLIYREKNFSYQQFTGRDKISIVPDSATLTEITYSFK
jgi:hypothetical protein